MSLGIRVLREQDQRILNAMPTQINGRVYPIPKRVEATHGRSRGAQAMIERAKGFRAPRYGTDADGNTVQVLISYPDGDSLYRHGGLLIVGEVSQKELS